MNATQSLPPDYTRHKTLNLSTPAGMVAMNLASVPLFFVFGAGFNWAAGILNPAYDLPSALSASLSDIPFLVGLVLVLFGMLVLHELIHGLFFWIFTRARPKFAFKGLYAYAAAPGWYLPRRQHFVVGLAPFVLISLGSLPAFAFLPPAGVLLVVVCATYNAAGALGDLLVAAWELFHSPRALVCDTGDAFSLHEPAP